LLRKTENSLTIATNQGNLLGLFLIVIFDNLRVSEIDEITSWNVLFAFHWITLIIVVNSRNRVLGVWSFLSSCFWLLRFVRFLNHDRILYGVILRCSFSVTTFLDIILRMRCRGLLLLVIKVLLKWSNFPAYCTCLRNFMNSRGLWRSLFFEVLKSRFSWVCWTFYWISIIHCMLPNNRSILFLLNQGRRLTATRLLEISWKTESLLVILTLAWNLAFNSLIRIHHHVWYLQLAIVF
jgi:hypothetical protein